MSSVNISHFSYLPFDLFVIVCSFLNLESKCRSLPVLSRHFNSSFKPDRCCQGDVAIILSNTDAATDDDVNDVLARIPYLPYASSLALRFNDYGYNAPDMLREALWSRVETGDLKSIKLIKKYDMNEMRRGEPRISSLFVEPLIRRLDGLDHEKLQSLHTLVLSCNTFQSFTHSTDWSFIRGCRSLHTLDVSGMYTTFGWSPMLSLLSLLDRYALLKLPHVAHLSCDFGVVDCWLSRVSSSISIWSEGDRSRRRFRTLQDSQSLDGRKVVADELFQQFSVFQKQLVAELDQGYEAATGHHAIQSVLSFSLSQRMQNNGTATNEPSHQNIV